MNEESRLIAMIRNSNDPERALEVAVATLRAALLAVGRPECRTSLERGGAAV